ncbi:DUF2474 domain-containing protein [Stappia sp. GBMRC 2046]|uniref:DUF2474 domain-containing protein n=1 Tax=Stappia sediminis TaxID=2692190 RepID=A0A7X3LWS8_9HYPH|nr:hypothetical protein [Stappia sediminis]MXN66581.1 DUF2474 domain-containing protein [Stappia sediminis]
MKDTDAPRTIETGPAWKRWLWFFGLWLAGVAAITALSYSIRFLLLQ